MFRRNKHSDDHQSGESINRLQAPTSGITSKAAFPLLAPVELTTRLRGANVCARHSDSSTRATANAVAAADACSRM